MLMLEELEGVPTSNSEVAADRMKLLPISIDELKVPFAGTIRIDPDELKLKYAAELSIKVSSSNNIPPPAVLL